MNGKNIPRVYEKATRKSGSEDKFENILKKISMDSRVGSAMSETMSRKISKNATEILDEALEKTEIEKQKS